MALLGKARPARRVLRSGRNACRIWRVASSVSDHAFFAVLSECFSFDHACCLPRERQTGRLAICFVPIPPWVGIAGSAFSDRRAVIGLGLFISGLRVFWRRSRRGTGGRGDRGTESAARQSAFLREHIGFVVLSAGSPLGAECGSRTAAAPDCAKEPLALWTLLIWVVMWVRFTQRRTLGYNVD